MDQDRSDLAKADRVPLTKALSREHQDVVTQVKSGCVEVNDTVVDALRNRTLAVILRTDLRITFVDIALGIGVQISPPGGLRRLQRLRKSSID